TGARVAWTLVGILLMAVAGLSVAHLRQASAIGEPNLSPTRLDLVTLPSADPFSFALSPDGRQMVFVATADGVSKLWLRPLDQSTARPSEGTDGASYPFWSPDRLAIAFFAQGKLKRLNLADGATQVLANAPAVRGGAWSRDDVIVFAPTTATLMQVPATGG